mmetsp:Transcript_19014/g.39127  ORF Transcript_19014/g.39127 Transcript_19014/m.39127 type:complete len:315 (-) Transcript_19014:482-1426(-)
MIDKCIRIPHEFLRRVSGPSKWLGTACLIPINQNQPSTDGKETLAVIVSRLVIDFFLALLVVKGGIVQHISFVNIPVNEAVETTLEFKCRFGQPQEFALETRPGELIIVNSLFEWNSGRSHDGNISIASHPAVDGVQKGPPPHRRILRRLAAAATLLLTSQNSPGPVNARSGILPDKAKGGRFVFDVPRTRMVPVHGHGCEGFDHFPKSLPILFSLAIPRYRPMQEIPNGAGISAKNYKRPTNGGGDLASIQMHGNSGQYRRGRSGPPSIVFVERFVGKEHAARSAQNIIQTSRVLEGTWQGLGLVIEKFCQFF